MADIKFSEFPKATTSKDSDEIAILQDGVNKMIPSPVLESKIINKTVSRVINQGGASLNVINLKGVVPTYADLALITPTPELNDAYQVEADGLVYVYTESGFQAEGDGFVVQSEPIGVVAEGNAQAVSGGEVYDFVGERLDNNIVLGNNLINTEGQFRAGSYSGNIGNIFSFSVSNNWLSMQPIFVDGDILKAGETYTIDGRGRLGAEARFITFVDVNGIVLSFIMGTGSTNNIPVTFTIPATAHRILLNIDSRTGAGLNPESSLFHDTLIINSGSVVKPYSKFGYALNLKMKTCYISSTGSDDGFGTKTSPIKTLEKAVELLDADGELIFLEGDYFDFNVDFSLFKTMRSEIGKRVRFIYGERISTATLVPEYTKVYSYPYVSTGSWLPKYNLWQHDIADVSTEIQMEDRYPIQNGQVYRLPCTKLKQVSSIAEVESSLVPCYFYDSANTIMYFQKVAGSNLAVNPIVIPKNEGISNSKEKNVYHKGIEIYYKTLFTEKLTGILENFKIFGTNNGTGCFTTNNTINLWLLFCEAGGASNDGFNGTTTPARVTNPFNNYTKIKLTSCWAHDCGDDGESHHNHCYVDAENCLSEYNANGFTAASGAHASYVGCIAQKNTANGFSSQGASIDDGIGTNILTNTCLSDRNNRNYVGRDIDTKYINSISISPVSGTHFSGLGVKINCVEL